MDNFEKADYLALKLSSWSRHSWRSGGGWDTAAFPIPFPPGPGIQPDERVNRNGTKTSMWSGLAKPRFRSSSGW